MEGAVPAAPTFMLEIQLELPLDDKKRMARLDISKDSQADEVELGDVVCVVLRGKVKALRGVDQHIAEPWEGGKKKGEKKITYPGSIEMEIQDMKITSGSDFDGMMDGDE